MDFYAHQDRARRRTTLLVTGLVLAVLGMVAALNALVYLVVRAGTVPPPSLASWLAQPYWLLIGALVVLLVLLGSAHTSLRLRGGGPALARLVGARRISDGGGNALERRFVNVVEEMALAAGLPAPALYLLDDETGINAFVAGTRPSETVLVLTRGALDALDRDELQGVVAHEFSHVFNGDMRLNLRLLGVLAGIVLLGQLGRYLLRAGSRSRDGRAWALLGLGVLAVGYIGLFCASVLKAAVSRQREFLADAAAVQFTRNPDGIAGALAKIAAHPHGGELDNAHAEDLSHFCFATGVRHAFDALFATHPPLAARLAALGAGEGGRGVNRVGVAGADPTAAVALGGAVGFSATGLAARAGAITPAHLAVARTELDGLPAAWLAQARAVDQVPVLIMALWFAAIPSARHAGLRALLDDHGLSDRVPDEQHVAALAATPRAARWTLLELALPTLGAAPASVRTRLHAALRALSATEEAADPYASALLQVCVARLATDDPDAVPTAPLRVADLAVLFSALAYAGQGDATAAAAAYASAMHALGIAAGSLHAPADCAVAAVAAALARLRPLPAARHRRIIDAAALCVARDGRVSAGEYELLRAIALAFDCPLPPLALDADGNEIVI